MRSDFEVSHGRDVVKTAAQEKIKGFSRVEKHEKHGPSLDKNAKLRRNIGWRIKKEDIDECIYNFTYCTIGNRISNWF